MELYLDRPLGLQHPAPGHRNKWNFISTVPSASSTPPLVTETSGTLSRPSPRPPAPRPWSQKQVELYLDRPLGLQHPAPSHRNKWNFISTVPSASSTPPLVTETSGTLSRPSPRPPAPRPWSQKQVELYLDRPLGLQHLAPGHRNKWNFISTVPSASSTSPLVTETSGTLSRPSPRPPTPRPWSQKQVELYLDRPLGLQHLAPGHRNKWNFISTVPSASSTSPLVTETSGTLSRPSPRPPTPRPWSQKQVELYLDRPLGLQHLAPGHRNKWNFISTVPSASNTSPLVTETSGTLSRPSPRPPTPRPWSQKQVELYLDRPLGLQHLAPGHRNKWNFISTVPSASNTSPLVTETSGTLSRPSPRPPTPRPWSQKQVELYLDRPLGLQHLAPGHRNKWNFISTVPSASNTSPLVTETSGTLSRPSPRPPTPRPWSQKQVELYLDRPLGLQHPAPDNKTHHQMFSCCLHMNTLFIIP